MGGTAVDEPDELDAMEIALEDEPDEPDEDNALEWGLKGDDWPANRGRRCCEYVESDFSRAGGLCGEAITHPKREEYGCPLLKLGPKRRPSQKREVRVKRGSACTSEEEGI